MSIQKQIHDAVSFQTFNLETAILAAEDAAGLVKAVKLLAFVKPLWVALGYEPSVDTVAKSVRGRAVRLANDLRAWHDRWPGQDRRDLIDLEELEEYDAR